MEQLPFLLIFAAGASAFVYAIVRIEQDSAAPVNGVLLFGITAAVAGVVGFAACL